MLHRNVGGQSVLSVCLSTSRLVLVARGRCVDDWQVVQADNILTQHRATYQSVYLPNLYTYPMATAQWMVSAHSSGHAIASFYTV